MGLNKASVHHTNPISTEVKPKPDPKNQYPQDRLRHGAVDLNVSRKRG